MAVGFEADLVAAEEEMATELAADQAVAVIAAAATCMVTKAAVSWILTRLQPAAKAPVVP
jgi:hypothetical protein